MQALVCVENRLPRVGRLPEAGYVLALALRYGLIGAAATYDLLQNAESWEDEREVLGHARRWPETVEEHVWQRVRHKLKFPTDFSFPWMIGRLSFLPVRVTLGLHSKCWPLEKILPAASERFEADYRHLVSSGAPFFARRKIRQEFCTLGEKSVDFALHFFERRQAELEELPEIALLGE